MADAVLDRMGKPRNAVYNRFVEKYFALNKQYGMNQYLVPYLMLLKRLATASVLHANVCVRLKRRLFAV